MDSVPHVNVPLRGGKKMKKRKELDALVAHTIKQRNSEVKRSSSAGGVSSHDQLLSDSTDEQEYWNAGGGKLRGRRPYLVRRRTCTAMLRACTALLVLSCVVATTTVMWLFIDVREQVASLRTELNQVVAGSQGVPDALQKCHSLSRDLQKNQTQIFNKLSIFSQQLNNLSLEMTEIRNGLHSVEVQLKPQSGLLNDPRLISDLSASVASFGSQIKDLDATVAWLKDGNKKFEESVNSLVTNVTEMQAKIKEISNVTSQRGGTGEDFAAEKEALLSMISQVAANLTSVNDTLSNKVQWTLDEQTKHRGQIDSLQDMNQNITTRVSTLESKLMSRHETPAVITSTPANVQTSESTEEVTQRTTTLSSIILLSSQNVVAELASENPP